jgi:hypothetical protein
MCTWQDQNWNPDCVTSESAVLTILLLSSPQEFNRTILEFKTVVQTFLSSRNLPIHLGNLVSYIDLWDRI